MPLERFRIWIFGPAADHVQSLNIAKKNIISEFDIKPLRLGSRVQTTRYLVDGAYAEVLRVVVLVVDVLHEVLQSSVPELVDRPAAQHRLHALVE
jgi:hypothetical protein